MAFPVCPEAIREEGQVGTYVSGMPLAIPPLMANG